jgi:modulator of FtsH protease HflK
VLRAYELAKDVTVQRLYLETMQEILTSTPSIIVDDRLQGVVPFLPLGADPTRPAARPMPAPAPTQMPQPTTAPRGAIR